MSKVFRHMHIILQSTGTYTGTEILEFIISFESKSFPFEDDVCAGDPGFSGE